MIWFGIDEIGMRLIRLMMIWCYDEIGDMMIDEIDGIDGSPDGWYHWPIQLVLLIQELDHMIHPYGSDINEWWDWQWSDEIAEIDNEIEGMIEIDDEMRLIHEIERWNWWWDWVGFIDIRILSINTWSWTGPLVF